MKMEIISNKKTKIKEGESLKKHLGKKVYVLIRKPNSSKDI